MYGLYELNGLQEILARKIVKEFTVNGAPLRYYPKFKKLRGWRNVFELCTNGEWLKRDIELVARFAKGGFKSFKI